MRRGGVGVARGFIAFWPRRETKSRDWEGGYILVPNYVPLPRGAPGEPSAGPTEPARQQPRTGPPDGSAEFGEATKQIKSTLPESHCTLRIFSTTAHYRASHPPIHGRMVRLYLTPLIPERDSCIHEAPTVTLGVSISSTF